MRPKVFLFVMAVVFVGVPLTGLVSQVAPVVTTGRVAQLTTVPTVRFKALSLDQLGPAQQAWLVQDLKHKDQCVLVIEALSTEWLGSTKASRTAGMVSQPWPCQ